MNRNEENIAKRTMVLPVLGAAGIVAAAIAYAENMHTQARHTHFGHYILSEDG
jgi:L-serine deaminase